jgi:hypothetical protein
LIDAISKLSIQVLLCSFSWLPYKLRIHISPPTFV